MNREVIMFGFGKKGVVAEESGPVEKMRDTAQKVVTSPSKLSQLKGKEVILRNLISGFLGVEAHAKAEAEREHAAIQKRICQLEKIPHVVSATGGAYQLIDIAPLKWRKENGDPQLVVFSLESGTFMLQVTVTAYDYSQGLSQWWRSTKFATKITPPMPHDTGECFVDLVEKLFEKGKKELPWFTQKKEHPQDFAITCQFQGLIPAEVKAKIEKARSAGIFQDFFLIAEATEVQHVTSDPLVIGYDGSNYWLIDAFMTTTLENQIAAEFAHKP